MSRVRELQDLQRVEGLSPEQAEARLREQEQRIGQMFATAELIVADAGGKKGVTGTVTCPVCGGTLRYSIAAGNGHVAAACRTEGCQRWMQ